MACRKFLSWEEDGVIWFLSQGVDCLKFTSEEFFNFLFNFSNLSPSLICFSRGCACPWQDPYSGSHPLWLAWQEYIQWLCSLYRCLAKSKCLLGVLQWQDPCTCSGSHPAWLAWQQLCHREYIEQRKSCNRLKFLSWTFQWVVLTTK